MSAAAIVLTVLTGLFFVFGLIWLILTVSLLRRTQENALLALRSFETTRQTLAILQKSLSMQVAGTMLGLLQRNGQLSTDELDVAVETIADAFPEERERFEELRVRLHQARGPRSAT